MLDDLGIAQHVDKPTFRQADGTCNHVLDLVLTETIDCVGAVELLF